jgi:hypothetical protein
VLRHRGLAHAGLFSGWHRRARRQPPARAGAPARGALWRCSGGEHRAAFEHEIMRTFIFADW